MKECKSFVGSALKKIAQITSESASMFAFYEPTIPKALQKVPTPKSTGSGDQNA